MFADSGGNPKRKFFVISKITMCSMSRELRPWLIRIEWWNLMEPLVHKKFSIPQSAFCELSSSWGERPSWLESRHHVFAPNESLSEDCCCYPTTHLLNMLLRSTERRRDNFSQALIPQEWRSSHFDSILTPQLESLRLICWFPCGNAICVTSSSE